MKLLPLLLHLQQSNSCFCYFHIP